MPTKTDPAKSAKPQAADPLSLKTIYQTVSVFAPGGAVVSHVRSAVTLQAAANAAYFATGSDAGRCAQVLAEALSISQTVDIGRLRVTVRWSDH